MDAKAENERIWAFFQGDASETFAHSRPRLDFLSTQAVRLARSSQISKMSVMNIGVGDAYLERRLKALGFAVTALDPNPKSIAGLKNHGIQAVAASLPDTGINSESFDLVVASEVIEHLGDDDLAASVAEVARLLKPNAAFIGTVPYREHLPDNVVHCPSCGTTFHRWGHHQSFDKRRLRRLLETEFDVEHLHVRAFVNFGERSFTGQVRGVIRCVLARLGHPSALPNLYFQAIKR